MIPPCEHIPLATMSKLLALAADGGSVVFADSLPKDVPGAGDLENRRSKFNEILKSLQMVNSADGRTKTAVLEQGRIVVGPLETALEAVDVPREPMTDTLGLQWIRRATADGYDYFIVNRSPKPLDGWVPLAVQAKSAAILDPMTGLAAIAQSKASEGGTQVYLQLSPGESLIVRAFRDVVTGPKWTYRKPSGNPIPIAGTWKLGFLEGGPQLPKARSVAKLASWTTFGDPELERFAGAARYTITFDAPVASSRGLLDLGTRVPKCPRASQRP